MQCAVTGATGFIGSELCRQLSALDALAVSAGRDIIPPDRLEGIHTLFHCAGVAHQSAAPEAHQSANCEAVLAQASAAREAAVRRFVFVSTSKAAADGNPYSSAKWQAEQGLSALSESSGLEVLVLRPPLVYGVGARANLRALMKLVRAGMPRPPAVGKRSLVGVRDLCAAMLRSRETALDGYQCFEVTDGEIYDLQRIYSAFRAALGKPPGRAWLPAPLWPLACGALDRLRGGGDTWATLAAEEVFNNEALCNALSWQPRDTLEDCAGEMMAALK